MVEGDAAGGAVAVGDEEVGVVCGHGLSVLCGCQACPLPGLAGVLRGDASFTNLDLRGRLEESCPAAKLSKIPSRTHSGKREEEKPQKRRKRKRTAFSVWRRWSVKVLLEKIMPGRQATFAGVFVFDIIINSLQHRNWANNISQIVKFAIFVSG